MTVRNVIFAATAASALAACETVHGISREADPGRPVDWACVQTAVKAAHPGTDVSEDIQESSRFESAPQWGAYVYQNRYLRYSIPGRGDLDVVIQSTVRDGKTTLAWWQVYLLSNRHVDETAITDLRTAMLATEREASTRCGLDFSSVKEWTG